LSGIYKIVIKISHVHKYESKQYNCTNNSIRVQYCCAENTPKHNIKELTRGAKMSVKKSGKSKKVNITVMVEIPKGSRNKYEYDKEKKRLKFDRMLFSSVHYPSDYGFILETLGQDGDPLDALVLVWESTFPGCIIEAKPVGVFKMSDEKGPDEKILCVPLSDPLWNHVERLSDVPPHLLKEIEHFFSIYKELENKKTIIEGWENLESALKIIREAQERYLKPK
jgi:inorganic pyrophosphatase